jgi:uncharacterized secreted protein with C-terminal beta-propeller domain
MGHAGGTQVSLFDVSDLAAPIRMATFALTNSLAGILAAWMMVANILMNLDETLTKG